MILQILSYVWALLCKVLTRYTVTFCIGCLVLYLMYWVRVRRYKHSLFQRLGIPYVKPHLIHGSLFTLRGKDALATNVIGEWLKTYGDVFGYYMGDKPTIVIKDLDLVKQVLMKDFNVFSNRPKVAIKINPITHTLIGLRDQRWKDVRSVLAPTFSLAKMKLIMGIMNKRVDELLEAVSKHNTKSENLEWYSIFQGLTLDVICECVMAMKRNCQRDQNNDEFFALTRTFLKHAMSPVLDLAVCFSILGEVFAFINNKLAFSGRMTNMIVSHVKDVLKIRRQDLSTKNIDLLQLMLEASGYQKEYDTKRSSIQNGTSTMNGTSTSNGTAGVKKEQPSEPNSKSGREGPKNKNLSDEEIIANVWVFMLAGFETSANAITSTAYLLACHPDIQEKLFLELSEHIEDGHKHITYDTLHKLNYLDQVFSEALRVFPPVVNFITRDTNKDFQLGDYFIPNDTDIMIPVWQIHHDPKLWPDPLKFDPDRFSPEAKASNSRHPMSYIPFGAGPRSCPGMRFAQMEAKMAIARLVRTHRLESCEQTPIPLEFTLPTVTHVPAQDVIFKAIPRE
ncbi:cytochrome P450 3A29-like [Palaemon carinicauda]|uniref:cytochrome P450 3A29-like n=1 Tax=Palaemon carinicauda TaxID=392227 RepID=UPI0035B64ADB